MTTPLFAPDVLDRIAALEQEVRELRRSARSTTATYLDPQGRVRVRVGVHADGKTGVRVFTAAGVLFFDQTTL